MAAGTPAPSPGDTPPAPTAARAVIVSASIGAGHDGTATELARQLRAAGWSVDTKTGEKYVTVTVTDATGQKVPGAFWTGSGTNSHTDAFCGATKNYQFGAGPVVIALDAVGATPACPGLATQGTVTLVFSNLP